MSDARMREHLQLQDKDIARKSSRPKVHTNPVHSGMTDQQCAGAGTKHVVYGAPDASSSSPLDTLSTSQYGKRLVKAPIHDGMVGHAAIITDNGEGVMAEGLVHAGPDHPNNLGRKRP
jgi:hypothetical protein